MKKIVVSLISLILMLGMVGMALGYSFTDTVGTQPVEITVEEVGDSIKWTVDFPMVAPYDPSVGNGHLTVGLIIATNGDGNGPAFQIHNNDGTDATYPWGTWLMSPWGPTIDDGWKGWHSGYNNTLLTDGSLDWVSATGDRDYADNPDAIYTITIDKCELGESFHWALNLAIGSGFSSQYYTYEQMAEPVATPGPSFNWGTPIVDMTVPNYILVLPTPPPNPEDVLSHFTVYEVDPEPVEGGGGNELNIEVLLDDQLLDDQFGTSLTVKKAKILLVPVSKNGECIVDGVSHLVCYELNDPEDCMGTGIDAAEYVEVVNQFNGFVGEQVMEVKKLKYLCVPSTKKVVPPPVEPEPGPEPSKRRCGAAPMYRDGVVNSSLSATDSLGKAFLPLLLALLSLSLWVVIKRRKKA